MFVCGLPQTLTCSYRERIVSLLLRRHHRHHWVMARHSTAGHSPLPHSAPLGHGTSQYRRPLSTLHHCVMARHSTAGHSPLFTTGSWHVTVPQAILHCPTLHHWVMARHSTAGHSPLPQPAPLGHGTSQYRRPLSTAPLCTTGSWHVTVPQATLQCPTLHHCVMARHSTAGHSPLCTTGSWHVTVPQATLHCPNLHHWVMARHSTAGHSPLPHSAPLGHGTSQYRRPLSTAPLCTTGSWHVTVPQATLHCPNCPHPSSPTRAPGLGQQLSPVFIPVRVTHTTVTPRLRRPTHLFSPRSYTWSELIASSGIRSCTNFTMTSHGSLQLPRAKRSTDWHLQPQSSSFLESVTTWPTACTAGPRSAPRSEYSHWPCFICGVNPRYTDRRHLHCAAPAGPAGDSHCQVPPGAPHWYPPPPPLTLPPSPGLTGGTNLRLPDSVMTLYRCFISRQLATVPRPRRMTANIMIMTDCSPRLFIPLVSNSLSFACKTARPYLLLVTEIDFTKMRTFFGTAAHYHRSNSVYSMASLNLGIDQFKKEDEEADRGSYGKTTSKSGLALNGTSCYVKLRTAGSGGSWL